MQSLSYFAEGASPYSFQGVNERSIRSHKVCLRRQLGQSKYQDNTDPFVGITANVNLVKQRVVLPPTGGTVKTPHDLHSRLIFGIDGAQVFHSALD